LRELIQWLLQRVTGLVLLAGLVVHFYVMHYSGGNALDYESVMARLESPYWKAFDILFLVAILYHGFNGLWGIAIEYIGNDRLLKPVQLLIVVLSLGLFFTGVGIIL